MNTRVNVFETHKIPNPAGDSFILEIQLLEGLTFLPGDKFMCEEDSSLTFIIHSVGTGGHYLSEDKFSIIIEAPREGIELSSFLGKTFVKSEEDE